MMIYLSYLLHNLVANLKKDPTRINYDSTWSDTECKFIYSLRHYSRKL